MKRSETVDDKLNGHGTEKKSHHPGHHIQARLTGLAKNGPGKSKHKIGRKQGDDNGRNNDIDPTLRSVLGAPINNAT